jgi:hypothetical protein
MPLRRRKRVRVRVRAALLVAIAGLAVLTAAGGCMISEQTGQGRQDLVFFFDTQFNQIMLYGRSAAIAAIALWVFASFKKKTGPILVGVGILAVALGLFAKDYPRLSRYKVQVLQQELVLEIPPEPEMRFGWEQIEDMYIEGVGPIVPDDSNEIAKMLDLPEWHLLRFGLAGGETHEVNLELLSIEQRQTLWKAIAARAHLRRLE